jgi:hypothetical protein
MESNRLDIVNHVAFSELAVQINDLASKFSLSTSPEVNHDLCLQLSILCIKFVQQSQALLFDASKICKQVKRMHHTPLEAHIKVLIRERSNLQKELTNEFRIMGPAHSLAKLYWAKSESLNRKLRLKLTCLLIVNG